MHSTTKVQKLHLNKSKNKFDNNEAACKVLQQGVFFHVANSKTFCRRHCVNGACFWREWVLFRILRVTISCLLSLCRIKDMLKIAESNKLQLNELAFYFTNLVETIHQIMTQLHNNKESCAVCTVCKHGITICFHSYAFLFVGKW